MEKFKIYQNKESEDIILSRLFSRNEEINMYPELKPEHFLYDINRKIFERMLIANNNGKPFLSKNIVDSQEELAYVSILLKNDSFRKIDGYVKDLIEDSDKYNALVKAQDVIDRAILDRTVDIFSELSEASTRDITERYDSSNEAMIKQLENKMKQDEKYLGIKSGIKQLDECMNNFQNGRLYTIGARSGMGKSAFMCSVINNIEPNSKVGIISLEMLASELKQRIACIRGKIPHWKIEKGRCENEFDDYVSSLMSIKNLIISDKGGLNRSQVISIVRQMVKRSKCKIVFIDHLGLIQVSDKGNLAHEIGKTTALLKSLSKELNIPIVCLCQINRAVEKESDKRPKMSDLRDSGRIEEDSDCVILLYRNGYYEKEPPKIEEAQYIVAKCRNGKRGIIDGMFMSEFMKFV